MEDAINCLDIIYCEHVLFRNNFSKFKPPTPIGDVRLSFACELSVFLKATTERENGLRDRQELRENRHFLTMR